MNTKFSSMLSASDQNIKAARAEAIAESTVLEVEAFIANLKRDKNTLKAKVTSLTDLAPDNSYSLRPGNKDFNAANWMKELHQVRMALKLKEIELTEAQAIYNEWFKAETSAA